MKFRALLLSLLPFFTFAQLQRKSLPAQKVTEKIQIDGNLNDPLWQDAPTAENFVMLIPGNGEPIPQKFRTKVKILYSNQEIWVAANMRDPAPDSILTQMTRRDVFDENTDWFGIFINPYNDGLSDFNFWVTAAGVQADSRTTPDGDDFSWNTVWESAVQIHDSGWSVEMRIPYLALRFPETPTKDWGLNIIRNIRRNREQYSWSFIDRLSGNRGEYFAGLLTGMENIEPPVRLSFQPYVSGYLNDFDGNSSSDFNAGLDLKYGINESFTLDVSLIPDFGQVAFDRQFLNLSPFENQFEENRQFFTEGTELFNIGNLFYSRRIGGAPQNITGQDLSENDTVTIRQEFTKLLNATKVSGRTNSNLGIGFLNAVTAGNFATFTDNDGNETEVLTEPLTNYNVLVLDQRFNRNSSVSFVNTNVWRSGNSLDANVAGLLTTLTTESGNYQLDVSAKRSDQIQDGETEDGYETRLRLADIGGNWRWAAVQTLRTDDYQINDLGFLTRNNQLRHYGEISYGMYVPKGKFNRWNVTLNSAHQNLYKPRRFEEFFVGISNFFLMRNFFAFGSDFRSYLVEQFDYFEPRVDGFYFKIPSYQNLGGFISSDYRKPVALDARIEYTWWNDLGRKSYFINMRPRLRFSDRLFMIPLLEFVFTDDDHGFATIENGQPYFGRRDVTRTTAALNATYIFTPQMSLGLDARHNWTSVNYHQFFELQRDGTLQNSNAVDVSDINFNTFNLDLKFSWWFAPASELVFLYRNITAAAENFVITDYRRNIDQLFNAPPQNNLSLRVTYFLDYNSLRKKPNR